MDELNKLPQRIRKFTRFIAVLCRKFDHPGLNFNYYELRSGMLQ